MSHHLLLLVSVLFRSYYRYYSFLEALGLILLGAFFKNWLDQRFPRDSSGLSVPSLPPASKSRGLRKITMAELGLDEQVFRENAQMFFTELTRAQYDRDLEPVRNMISDALSTRLTMQMEQTPRQHYCSKFEKLTVERMDIIAIRCDSKFDTIVLRILATIYEYSVDELGDPIPHSNKSKPKNERWTFIRSVNARNHAPAGQAMNCPNCGSPVDFNAVGECEYCHSKLTRADFDWVLSEITKLNV